MKFAIVSDIHSNITALEAVLADIESQGVKTIYCLGDVIGYGPHPKECADLIIKHCDKIICGNHDEALTLGGIGFNGRAKRAIEWTAEQLKPGFFSGMSARRRWDKLTNLELKFEIEDDMFVHGSPRDCTTEYILPSDASFGLTSKLDEIFSMFKNRLFVGHSHLPMILTDEAELLIPENIGNEYETDPEQQVIINVGSVGQPRDQNPKSCYVIVDGTKIIWRRVEYDMSKTVADIKSIEKLDISLAERLLAGA